MTPQTSATEWKDAREMESPAVMAVPSNRLPRVIDEAARTIADEFSLPVADIRLGSRVAYSRCMITGQTAPEYEPEGKAARETVRLYKWVCRLVDMPTKKEPSP